MSSANREELKVGKSGGMEGERVFGLHIYAYGCLKMEIAAADDIKMYFGRV